MTRKIYQLGNLLIFILLAGCSSLQPPLSTPTSAPPSLETITPGQISTPSPTPEAKQIIRVWVPPRFDPTLDNPASELLKQRLNDFENDHPRVQIEVRVKSELTLMDALSTTSTAAPQNLPDLIALTSSDMQSAAASGYLHPLQGLTSIMQDPDWYAFAREMGRVQNTEYGIPFAGDAYLIVYRASVFSEPPDSWDAILASGNRMAFAVSDPLAHFPLGLYISAGGSVVDEQGAPVLDEAVLIQVLSFYQKLVKSGALPIAVRDYKTDAETLNFFRSGDVDLAVIRASSDIQTRSGEYLPLIGLAESPRTPADGWVWSLAGRDAERQEIAVELASYLVESDFLSEWTMASGYLPTRPQALSAWTDDGLKLSIEEVLKSAEVMPSEKIIDVVGPVLQEALIKVVNGEQVEEAARGAVENLK